MDVMEVAWVRAKVVAKVAARMDVEDAKVVVNIHVRPCAVILVVEVVNTNARHLVVETVAPDVEEVVKQLVLEHVAIHVMDHVIVIMQIQQKKIQ